MRKFPLIVISGLLCCSLLSGCNKEDDSIPSEIVGSDVSQTEEIRAFPAEICGVKLSKAVGRAVSLSPAATEIICELGFADKLVGVSDYCDYPESLSAPKLGSPENPDLEEIMRLMPDAVFTISPLSERETYLLQQAKIAVLEIPMPMSMEGYSEMYGEIAAAFYGKETVGEKGDRKSDRIGVDARKALEKAASGVELGTFVYVTEKLTIAGSDTFESAVLGLAGTNACARSGYIAAGDLSGDTPAFVIADSALTEEKIKGDAALKAMLNGGAKLRFVSSRCFERPSARTAEVFAELSSTSE